MIVDSHAHLDDSRFAADRSEIIQRAWNSGVRCILTIGNGEGPDDMGCGIPFTDSYGWILTSVGVHPHEALKVEERHFEMMTGLAAHPRVVAIGETGLDYHYDNSPREVQREIFRRQLELAGQLDLPAIIHTREADKDTEEILRDSNVRRGVLHCFTSGARLAEVALELGFMISFSGIVTFAKDHVLAGVARSVPSDRLLVETDCPYLAPVPHRGKRNEPAFVVETARFLAAARDVSLERLVSETWDNFSRLFRPGNLTGSLGQEGN
jgi:TatD DNase family protein